MKRILALLIVAAGFVLMLYPWISNRIYDHSVDSTVEVYEKGVTGMERGGLEHLWVEAAQYNEELSHSLVQLTDPFVSVMQDREPTDYYDVLSLDAAGLMCFVDIPKIGVYLPVYHGTSADILERGVGHLEGSSLPIGGEGTHSVLSAHSGMNSLKLFSDLTKIQEGDLFFLHVLNEIHAYRVYDIQVIVPDDTSQLIAEPGRDIVTLLTCTPYGVNTHRLIVKGERTQYTEEVRSEAQAEISHTDSQWMQSYKKAVLSGLCIVAAVYACMKLYGKRTRCQGIEKRREVR